MRPAPLLDRGGGVPRRRRSDVTRSTWTDRRSRGRARGSCGARPVREGERGSRREADSCPWQNARRREGRPVRAPRQGPLHPLRALDDDGDGQAEAQAGQAPQVLPVQRDDGLPRYLGRRRRPRAFRPLLAAGAQAPPAERGRRLRALDDEAALARVPPADAPLDRAEARRRGPLGRASRAVRGRARRERAPGAGRGVPQRSHAGTVGGSRRTGSPALSTRERRRPAWVHARAGARWLSARLRRQRSGGRTPAGRHPCCLTAGC